MQKQEYLPQRKSGAKAMAIDERAQLVKIRLLQLLAVIISAIFALGLHLFFGH
ncbi:MAG TPA: hypothetical protein VFA41_22270 [Ktedonobacteraceae bacterium]|jgi:hypothetical protein|nr:hypothetical protein [Ktedonobacteraceae bacterium]